MVPCAIGGWQVDYSSSYAMIPERGRSNEGVTLTRINVDAVLQPSVSERSASGARDF